MLDTTGHASINDHNANLHYTYDRPTYHSTTISFILSLLS